MAKHCAVCNQFYDDNLAACPHCQAARTHSRPADEETIDLGARPPGQESDSAASAQALEALLSDSAGDEVVEVLPEGDKGARQQPPADVPVHGGTQEPPAASSGARERAAADADLHEVIEDFRTRGSGTRQRPPTAIDIVGMMEGPLDILPERPEHVHAPVPPSAAETEHVIEIFPESVSAPEPTGPGPSQPVVMDVSPESPSGIDIEALEVAEPSSGISSKESPAAEAQGLSSPQGPEAAPSSALDEDEAAAVLDSDSAILAEPISSTSGEMYVASDAVETPSGSIMVTEAAEEAPPASGIVVAGREPAADLPAGAMPGPTVVADVPNLELDSKIRKDAGAGADEEILDAMEVAETASGAMPPSAPPSGAAGEAAGVFDDGEEVLDVTEEASSAALGASPSGRQPAAAPPGSGVTPAHEGGEADVLDAEEVLEGAEASGNVPSDIISEALDSGVNVGGSGRSSSAVLDEKGIEDLLMGPEEGAPSSRRMEASEAVEEPPAADEEVAAAAAEPAAAEEEEAAAAKPKKFGRALNLTPVQALVAGVGVGIVVLAGITAGAWLVARGTVMDVLGVQKKQPPPTPLELAHGLMDKGQYGEAVRTLEGAGNAQDVLTARAQARWLKYLHDRKNQSIDARSPEVVKARQEAKDAKNDALGRQINSVIAAQRASSQLAASEKALRAWNLDTKDVAKTIESLAKEKDKAERERDKAKAANQQVVGALATQLKVKPDAVPRAVNDLVAARITLDAKLKDIDDKLKAAKVDDEGPAGVAKLADAKGKLERERAELDSTIKGAFDLLRSAGLAPPDVDPHKGLVEATKMAVDKARNPMVISQNPEQKLDTWIALLQDRSHRDPSYLSVARNDGQRVLDDPRAGEEAKAKAQYVIALADRNSGQAAQAREAFGKAVKAAAAAKAGALAKAAGETLRELTDASAYYLPRAERLQAAGDWKGALTELDAAVQQNPGDGRLHARRALVRLEMQPTGKIDPAAQNMIRQDAEAARSDPRTAAEGAYVLGRLDEELGNYDVAEKQYRAALEAHKGNPNEASRYIIALARILQRDRGVPAEAPPAQPAPAPKEAKESKVSEASWGAMPTAFRGHGSPSNMTTQGRGHGTLDVTLLTALLIGLQPADEEMDAATAARLRESLDLAKRLIDSADPKVKGQGYILMGQALSRQGKRSEGLQLYVKGMQLAYPGEATRELSRLIAQGPITPEPEQVAPVETFLAERHYGKGLHEFWKRQYAAAEDDFAKAVASYDQDARYYYYLGMSRLLQGTTAKQRLARRDFQKGARLEAENRPGPRIVNASLERLQGHLRYYLDEYRQKQQ